MVRYRGAPLLILSSRNMTKNAHANCVMWDQIRIRLLQPAQACPEFAKERWLCKDRAIKGIAAKKSSTVRPASQLQMNCGLLEETC
jgi:hypothetical protein